MAVASSCRQDDHERNERRERDRVARVMLANSERDLDMPGPEPLFTAPVRVSLRDIFSILIKLFLNGDYINKFKKLFTYVM